MAYTALSRAGWATLAAKHPRQAENLAVCAQRELGEIENQLLSETGCESGASCPIDGIQQARSGSAGHATAEFEEPAPHLGLADDPPDELPAVPSSHGNAGSCALGGLPPRVAGVVARLE